MTRQTILLLFTLTCVFYQTTAQTYKQQFNDLLSKKDTAGQIRLLRTWEKSDNNDPELYVAYFNYYVKKSMNDVISLGNNPKGKDAYSIMNKDSTVGYIYDGTYYDTTLLNKGFNAISKGIVKTSARLDMRFGKIYMYGQIEDYESFTNEIIKAIDYSAVIKNEWTWTDNKPVKDPKKFMLSSIQTYQLQLYNTNNDDLLVNMKRIAEAVLKYYPDHVESWSNLSIVHLLKQDYDQALEALLKAEKLAPTDFIVLSNIAHAFKSKGDKKNAIRYYELTIKHGDEPAKKFAQGQIDELKKK